MRAADGVIFDVSNVPETVQKPPPVKVESKTPQAVEPQPQMELERVYQEALSASQGQDWEEAWNLYRRIIAIDPHYKDVEIKLDQARTQVLLAKLYDQAEQLLRSGQWKEAVSKIKQIHAVDPDYSDPKGLLARAQKNAEEAERQDRMQMLYRQAHGAIQARRWQNAIELLVQVKAIESGYRETERLLELSRAELEKEQTHASEQSAAPTPIPTTPPVSARFADASGERVTPGIRTSNSGKPVNLWLLIGLGGSGLVFLAIAVLFLIGILPPSVPPTPPLPPEPAALDGIYLVQSVADGLFWNMDGGVGGDNLLSTRNQPNDSFNMFSFESQEDGSYRIQVVGTGLYLHEDGLDTLFVNQIDEADDYTRFYLEDRGAGVYRIRVKASNRYLHYNGPDDKLITTRYQEDSKWTWFRLVAAGE
jgi:outer membrane protein assembly factor BamD (BamD/ComL family)